MVFEPALCIAPSIALGLNLPARLVLLLVTASSTTAHITASCAPRAVPVSRAVLMELQARAARICGVMPAALEVHMVALMHCTRCRLGLSAL
ncbi:hypothetical protein JKP88DRAFT_222556 [Tribonema minus]|uniref:Secreted protein n=1 Tax=Tribonema minus TaxID=303371 RepID=A0A835YTS2_9STRA|nr:hypothetical protein JKP88DRAFT_222556 [Tribonema minus]